METPNLRHQVMATNPLEEVLCCPNLPPRQQQQERKPRPQPEKALRCPRCDSTNTKFCYYNNYSLSQPRYFCKGCRRYWTKGGTLRNVPVGGGCRKNKRSSSSSKKTQQDQTLPTSSNPLLPSLPPSPSLMLDPSDLTLAFSRLHRAPASRQLGLEDRDDFMLANPSSKPIPPLAPSFIDILRSGFLDRSASAMDDMYYGFGGHGNMEEMEGAARGEQAVTPFEGLPGATASIKQESSCKSADGDNRSFMGLQWQAGGDGNIVVDPGRDYWNGVSSGWPGLVNSFLV